MSEQLIAGVGPVCQVGWRLELVGMSCVGGLLREGVGVVRHVVHCWDVDPGMSARAWRMASRLPLGFPLCRRSCRLGDVCDDLCVTHDKDQQLS